MDWRCFLLDDVFIMKQCLSTNEITQLLLTLGSVFDFEYILGYEISLIGHRFCKTKGVAGLGVVSIRIFVYS